MGCQFFRRWGAFSIGVLVVSGATASAAPCPTTAAAWSQWRSRQIIGLARPTDLAGRASLLDQCASEPGQQAFFQNAQFNECMANLRQASTAMRALAAGSRDNSAIFANPPDYYGPRTGPLRDLTELPSLFNDTAFMTALAANPPVQANLDAQVARMQSQFPGSQLIRYTPLFLQGRDVYIAVFPEPPPPATPRFDRWVHLIRGGNGEIVDMIMVSVQRQDATGRAIDPPLTRFASFEVPPVVAPTGPQPPTYHSATRGSPTEMNCYKCHRTGAMPVVEAAGTTSTSLTPGMSAADVIRSMNSRVSATATAVPADFNMRGFGPPLGPEATTPLQPNRMSPAFFQRCAPGLNQADVITIRDNMNCASCHDGSMAGPFSAPQGPLDFGGPVKIMEGFVTSGHMPPGGLPERLRRPLYNCLVAEYYGGFTDPVLGRNPDAGLYLRWIVERPCPGSVPPLSATSGVNSVPAPIIEGEGAGAAAGAKKAQ
jgi:hypothetical protein